MSRYCSPDCQRAMNAQEEHEAAERAALVAANLISSARLILGLDSEFTEYSAQYFVDNAGPKKASAQGEIAQQRSSITIQDYLEYLVDIASPQPESVQREMDELLMF